MYEKPIFPSLDKTLGYLYFLDKDHPLSTGSAGRVYLHRHLASISLGRWLTSSEHVHHRDGDKLNNSRKNLEVLSNAEHGRRHSRNCLVACVQCGELHSNKRFCSVGCFRLASRKVMRPTKEQLIEELNQYSWCALGRKYGVSDNAVRKWARTFDLL